MAVRSASTKRTMLPSLCSTTSIPTYDKETFLGGFRSATFWEFCASLRESFCCLGCFDPKLRRYRLDSSLRIGAHGHVLSGREGSGNSEGRRRGRAVNFTKLAVCPSGALQWVIA